MQDDDGAPAEGRARRAADVPRRLSRAIARGAAARATASGRSTRGRAPTAASRAATSASASCSDGPRAALRRPRGAATPRRRPARTAPARRPADAQPGPRDAAQPGVQGQPQAARRPVPLARPPRVRRRHAPQLQGRRPAADGPLPAARRALGGRSATRRRGRCADFVRSLLRADRRARVVVLGDFNDFDFSRTLRIVAAAGCANLMATLPRAPALLLRVRGQLAGARPDPREPGARARRVYDSVHVNASSPTRRPTTTRRSRGSSCAVAALAARSLPPRGRTHRAPGPEGRGRGPRNGSDGRGGC